MNLVQILVPKRGAYRRIIRPWIVCRWLLCVITDDYPNGRRSWSVRMAEVKR